MAKHAIVVTAMVASRDHSPQVAIAIPHKDTAVQCSPDEARDLARSLMEAAHDAETDSAIVAYCMTRGGGIEHAATLLRHIRAAREETP